MDLQKRLGLRDQYFRVNDRIYTDGKGKRVISEWI